MHVRVCERVREIGGRENLLLLLFVISFHSRSIYVCVHVMLAFEKLTIKNFFNGKRVNFISS